LAKRVLIVEDEPNIVESLRFLLEREGLDVAVQSDGALAMDSITATKSDLVILDVMLPNRSGFDILRDLHQKPGMRPKVMVLTAKGQARDRSTAEEIGVDSFMTKPFSNKEIVATVLRLLA
jgi:DNA-binding response OmpR family regulator